MPANLTPKLAEMIASARSLSQQKAELQLRSESLLQTWEQSRRYSEGVFRWLAWVPGLNTRYLKVQAVEKELQDLRENLASVDRALREHQTALEKELESFLETEPEFRRYRALLKFLEEWEVFLGELRQSANRLVSLLQLAKTVTASRYQSDLGKYRTDALAEIQRAAQIGREVDNGIMNHLQKVRDFDELKKGTAFQSLAFAPFEDSFFGRSILRQEDIEPEAARPIWERLQTEAQHIHDQKIKSALETCSQHLQRVRKEVQSSISRASRTYSK